MKLIYIDEAGATGIRADPAQPMHLLAAVLLDESRVRPIEDDLRTLGYKHFGAKSGDTNFEFRGYDIYHGKGYFAGMKAADRIALVHEILGVIEKHQVSIGYVAVDKAKSRAGLHPHQLAFLLLVERIEDWLMKENALGLIIADENEDIEQRLTDDLEIFKTENTRFGLRPTKIDHVVDSIHFVQSKNNRLIQLADIVAAATYRGLRTDEELRSRFLNDPDPTLRPPNLHFSAWTKRFASQKQHANRELWDRLRSRCAFMKTFPQ
ncbi:MAG: DUF3800 domain-containing protein [Proteobacteria bacterium]|nr:DUF3800 domain-containing protein [Pseudomonadota bacterium]